MLDEDAGSECFRQAGRRVAAVADGRASPAAVSRGDDRRFDEPCVFDDGELVVGGAGSGAFGGADKAQSDRRVGRVDGCATEAERYRTAWVESCRATYGY